MTEFWKSNPRKQCDFCKCWIADNKASIEFHEKGKNHKENVKRRLAEVKKKAAEKRKQDEVFSTEFAAMEAAALKAVQKDLQCNPSIVGANDLEELVNDTARRQEKQALATKDAGNNSTETWMVCQAPQGHTYYYNKQTGESQWEMPHELNNDKSVKKTENDASTKDLQKAEVKNDIKSERDTNQESLGQTEMETHPLLGGWITVPVAEKSETVVEDNRIEETEPSENDASASLARERTTDPEVYSHASRKRVAAFKEKTVKSLQNTDFIENIGFKKRKVKNNRNVRKRDDDDD